jgi:hypothetical protein
MTTTYTKEHQIEIVSGIRDLIGRQGLFMLGAKNLGYGVNSEGNVYLSFRISGSKVKFIRIALNGLDLYNVEFLNMRGQVISSEENIYNDRVRKAIEEHTGLYLKLF